MINGILILLFAGLCQGSFGLGYKKHEPYSWAVFWGIYNIMCIITSVIFTLIFLPQYFNYIVDIGLKYVIIPILTGSCWGLSAICFSKGIDKIGMSLVYGISMGISTIVGSILPMIINNSYPQNRQMILFVAGIILTVLGVIIITIAGVKREEKYKKSYLGIILSILSGIGSGFMNVGFSKGDIVACNEVFINNSFLALSIIKWLPVLVGGCFCGFIYCVIETTKLKQWKQITKKGSALCSIKLFLTSIIWYLALILYGYSVYLLGETGKTTGWIIFNALALVISVFWGLITNEWKNKKKTLLFIGCFILIISWIFLSRV